MVGTKLVISDPTETKEVLLNPKGMILGRDANCDILLSNKSISRHHARIFQDPFGRWIIEDLGSHNGIYVEEKRVKAQAVSSGQKISILPFTMYISDDHNDPMVTMSSKKTTLQIIDIGLEEIIQPYNAKQAVDLSPILMQQLNELTSQLLQLSSPSELYSQACLLLAEMFETLVAVIRSPSGIKNVSQTSDILACHFGKLSLDESVSKISNVHFSKRVLDAVQTMDMPIMASSNQTADKQIQLTLVDKSLPHVVFAARVNDMGDSIDVLYIDILESKAPKEMFDFVEAISRQINFVQKSLFFAELQKQERALRVANSQLQEKDRIKDEYVSRVTHDIKGHLAAIQSCLHVASDQSSDKLSPKELDFLFRAIRRTTQVTDFVNDLLELTRMRLSGKFEKKAFSVRSAIEQALEVVKKEAEDKSITLTSNIAQSLNQICGDQFSINELITNLLFNAIKYTPQNKTVHLEAKDFDDCIQIDFCDTGIGIPPDEVEHVFDEFFRATNARENAKEGTGLGLSIVKQIVERHGGTISVKSKQNQGSTFTVLLPKE